ncbi:MAG: CoA transferase subunit A [Acidobacteriota bacterium]|nr:CoA transferase subunit A [Acidobacteriota bacterium]
MNKVVASALEAVADVPDGATLMCGGFGMAGVPENLILALRERGVKGLTIISNNAGMPGHGLALLLATGQIRKMISSYIGENKLFEEQILQKKIEVELTPQGTLSERMRAAGAGIAAFYTPTGAGTLVAEGKEVREFDGRRYVLERPLRADFALVRAFRGDTTGNLIYRKTARNFNPVMATAARCTIAEVEHIAEPGEIDPECVVTPGVYVDRVVRGENYERWIEKRTHRTPSS